MNSSSRLLQILIFDYDKMEYALSRPVPLHSITAWIKAIIQQHQAGRDLRYEEFLAGGEVASVKKAEHMGFLATDIESIIPDTNDRSSDYTGNLPQYAATADRSRLVKILCKGQCGCESIAELNHEFPGMEQLRGAEMFQFTATCLKCGYEASDNYNWYR